MKKIFEALHNVIHYFVVALFLIPMLVCYWTYCQISKLFKKNEQ